MDQEQHSSSSQNDPNGQTHDSSDEGEEDGEQYQFEMGIDFTLLEWIKANKLTFIKQILLQQEISLTEIASLSQHQRRQFVDSLQIENPIFAKRLLNAVLLLNEQGSVVHCNGDNHTIEHTILKKKEYVDESIKNVNDCLEVLKIQMTHNKTQINKIYDEVVAMAHKHKKIALGRTSQVYETKFAVLNIKLNKFQQMQQKILECKENPDSDQSEILSFQENDSIMNALQSTDIIQLKISNDNIDEYIQNILCVTDINSIILPPNINVSDIGKDCICMSVSHDMNDLNVTKYELKYCPVYEDYDQRMPMNGHKYQTQIINNNDIITYKLCSLKSGTNYVLSVRLYSSLLKKWSLFCKNIHIKTNKDIHYGGRVSIKDTNVNINHSFINCIIHCLSNTLHLRDYFVSLQWKQYIKNSNCLTNIFGNILLDIWSNRNDTISHSLSQFLNGIKFDGDPFQFIVYILETLHSELNIQRRQRQKSEDSIKLNNHNRSTHYKQYMSNNQSKIVDLFDFQYKTDIICLQCKKHYINYDISSYLSLPIHKIQRKSFIIDIFHRGHAGYHDSYNNNTNKPVRHIFHCDPYGIVKDLAKVIAKKYGVKRQFVLFYENKTMKVIREYEHKMLIRNVPNHIAFSCYILKDWNREITAEEVKMKSITLWLAKLCHGIAKNSHKSHHLFGMPFVLSFISIHTKKDIYKHVYERLYIWLGSEYLLRPPKISTKQAPNDIENGMKTYDTEWNQILYRKLSFKLKLITKECEDSKENISEIPINDTVFDNQLYMKSKHVDIIIEWKSKDIYERIKNVMNKVIVNQEYKNWKKVKNAQNKGKNSKCNLSLYDLFDYYTSKQNTDHGFNDNPVMNGQSNSLHFCSRCKKKQKYSKKIDLCTFPKYLVIHLQRSKDKNSKNNKPKFVDCPLIELRLNKYKIKNKLKNKNSFDVSDEVIDICDHKHNFDDMPSLNAHYSYPFEDEKSNEPIYDLYASAASQNEEKNKYFCYIKNSDSQSEKTNKNQWYHFKEQITLIRESQIISPNTYLLFYKKR